jgi:nicotinamide-nucleotide amidase
MDNELIKLSENLGLLLKAKKLKIAIAESCTGGGLCQFITEVAGCSAWFECGFVTYSNAAKIKMLGVKAETLERFGAVSEEVALEMAEGALIKSGADCAIAITGIAGPTGDTVAKPVGTVFVAVQTRQQKICYKKYFIGARHEIRLQTLKFALNTIITDDFLVLTKKGNC